MFHIRIVWTYLIGALASLALPAVAVANPGDLYLHFYSSKYSWENKSITGHAFLCVAYHLNSGIKEECFGFYPKGGGLDMLIGGPGVADNEALMKKPNRFNPGELTGEVSVKVTDTQLKATYKTLNEWNAKNYKLTNSNCISFVNAVAAGAGLKTPEQVGGMLPTTYLSELKKLNGM